MLLLLVPKISAIGILLEDWYLKTGISAIQILPNTPYIPNCLYFHILIPFLTTRSSFTMRGRAISSVLKTNFSIPVFLFSKILQKKYFAYTKSGLLRKSAYL